MFYSIREAYTEDGDPTGTYYVGFSVDPDAFLTGRNDRDFDSVEDAKAEYGAVRWEAPDAEAAPDVFAAGWGE